MTTIANDEIVVLDIAGDRARVATGDAQLAGKLLLMGFAIDGDQFVMKLESVEARVSLVNKFIELGAIFSEGAGWSPAEILVDLCEKGLVKGPYRVVSWTGQGQYRISTR